MYGKLKETVSVRLIMHLDWLGHEQAKPKGTIPSKVSKEIYKTD
jgi:hypothetical protein